MSMLMKIALVLVLGYVVIIADIGFTYALWLKVWPVLVVSPPLVALHLCIIDLWLTRRWG